MANPQGPRVSREDTTRVSEQREEQWRPADLLPEPRKQAGWDYGWIRKSTLGVADPVNMSRNMREGYEPCKLSDHPELQLAVDSGAKQSDLVEVGGLILCKIPSEIARKREAYYQGQTNNQLAAVDAQLQRVNDPRMPVFKEHTSEVKFGSGR